MNKDVIVALDFENETKLYDFLEEFKGQDVFVKVGMELYYQYGPSIITKLKSMGFKIFLDLKLHDIPNTVVRTMKILKDFNVDIINLHATVGSECMKQVKEVFKDSQTKVIAVTVLTSTDKEMLKDELKVEENLDDYVINLATLTHKSGLDGVVCSPLEVVDIKNKISNDFLTITPGIRYKSGEDDQKRITTPKEAKVSGSDYIVVGRLITTAENRIEMYNKIKSEFLGE